MQEAWKSDRDEQRRKWSDLLGKEQVWKRKVDYAEKLRGMCRSRDGLVVWRFWTGYKTFSATPVASQTVAVGIREFGFEEVTERD